MSIMNIYAFFPLVATVAYVPLIFSTAESKPWQQKHRLFTGFLVIAMMWSLTDYFFRINVWPGQNMLLARIIILLFTANVALYHLFISSFYAPGQKRWVPIAYLALAVAIVLLALGVIPEKVIVDGDKVYPGYGFGIIALALPIAFLLARSALLLWRRLKVLDNPAARNQIVSLLFGILILSLVTLVTFLPVAREYPWNHFGNLVNAVMLSYATIRHKLVDVKFVLRRGLVLVIIGTIFIISYLVFYYILLNALGSPIDLTTTFSAIFTALVVTSVVYNLRGYLLVTMGRAFEGRSFDSRARLSDFTREIHTVFSLKEQGGELLELVTRATGCKKACLLFLDDTGNEFKVQLCEPISEFEGLSTLHLKDNNPIVQYLRKERTPFTREDVAVLPEFRSMWQQEKDDITASDLELFMPLISRGRLIGIMCLDKKRLGRYTLEDLGLLEEVTSRVAVSMEKEYLRELLREREEELSIINRSSAILTSSLDIQRIYGSFIKELKRAVNVNWASIVLLEGEEIYFLALSSEIGSPWQAGERIPAKNTAIEYLVSGKTAIIEQDLAKESNYATGRYFLEQGIRTVVYLPLMVKGGAIGCLAVASRRPNAYTSKEFKLLEELASLIAMPIENSRLYARAEQMARSDSLTGLLNRRSMDELVAAEVNRHSRYGGMFSIIVLDVDSLKAYNDTHGHPAGDEILKRVGSIIKYSIRNTDQAFRYGGDEFAVLLPQTDGSAALTVAERVRNRIATVSDPGHIPVTATLGIACWPTDGVVPGEVIGAADTALLQAKRSGGNRIHVYTKVLASRDSAAGARESGEDSRVLSTIYNLAATVDARDHYTCSHSKKVNEYAVALAEELHMDPLEISRLSTCAFLHDIGKIGISDEILNKPGKLNEEEWRIVKHHTRMGAAIASHAGQLAPCINGILHHHERYDGTGYPNGLKGEEIPLEARILAIADACAAMLSERRYSAPLTREQTLDEMKRCAGKQFDPKLVEVFMRVMEKETVTLVKENGGR